ncbi:MAG: 4-(cytidine 5'-diphospho)-2-C-methyl-D-erythritol kinase [Acidobacteria bacterium]|nr:4-(cytidine 5'-diphospho)-2-C-methyl-D-erythritol kinase [Acidobacteriota bacterium]
MGQEHLRGDRRTGNPGGIPGTRAGPHPGQPGPSRGARPESGGLTRIAVRAHAKINLNLRITGRRPDGYHLIESAIQSISLHDTLTLERTAHGILLEVDVPDVPRGPENLVWKAAAAFLDRPAGGPRGVRIRLEKRIPSGAGLGGGSSDAAAALVGLARLCGFAASDPDLTDLAASIGSDVPYFLTGGTALVTGTGTEVHPLADLSGYEVLIVFPGVPVSTREVYGRVAAPLTSALKISSMPRFKPTPKDNLPQEVEAWVRAGNDLEPYACALCPAIGPIKDRLQAAGASAAAKTGSGSAVFGIFRSPAAMERALAEMSTSGIAVARCAPINRQEYRRRAGFD